MNLIAKRAFAKRLSLKFKHYTRDNVPIVMVDRWSKQRDLKNGVFISETSVYDHKVHRNFRRLRIPRALIHREYNSFETLASKISTHRRKPVKFQDPLSLV